MQDPRRKAFSFRTTDGTEVNVAQLGEKGGKGKEKKKNKWFGILSGAVFLLVIVSAVALAVKFSKRGKKAVESGPPAAKTGDPGMTGSGETGLGLENNSAPGAAATDEPTQGPGAAEGAAKPIDDI